VNARGDGEQQPSAEVTSTDDGTGCWTVRIRGELDVAELPRARRCLEELFAACPSSIVIELADMTFIDSSGLGVLVSALKQTRELGGTTLVLRNLQDPVRRVFEITRLLDLFEIEP
jgi:anti-sigma B factor antagonist